MIGRDFVKWSVAGGSLKSGFNESVIAAEDGRRISDPHLFQNQHRTGTGVLGRSRAVGDNHLVTGQFLTAVTNLCVGNVQRPLNMAGRECRLGAHVNQNRLIMS